MTTKAQEPLLVKVFQSPDTEVSNGETGVEAAETSVTVPTLRGRSGSWRGL